MSNDNKGKTTELFFDLTMNDDNDLLSLIREEEEKYALLNHNEDGTSTREDLLSRSESNESLNTNISIDLTTMGTFNLSNLDDLVRETESLIDEIADTVQETAKIATIFPEKKDAEPIVMEIKPELPETPSFDELEISTPDDFIEEIEENINDFPLDIDLSAGNDETLRGVSGFEFSDELQLPDLDTLVTTEETESDLLAEVEPEPIAVTFELPETPELEEIPDLLGVSNFEMPLDETFTPSFLTDTDEPTLPELPELDTALDIDFVNFYETTEHQAVSQTERVPETDTNKEIPDTFNTAQILGQTGSFLFNLRDLGLDSYNINLDNTPTHTPLETLQEIDVPEISPQFEELQDLDETIIEEAEAIAADMETSLDDFIDTTVPEIAVEETFLEESSEEPIFENVEEPELDVIEEQLETPEVTENTSEDAHVLEQQQQIEVIQTLPEIEIDVMSGIIGNVVEAAHEPIIEPETSVETEMLEELANVETPKHDTLAFDIQDIFSQLQDEPVQPIEEAGIIDISTGEVENITEFEPISLDTTETATELVITETTPDTETPEEIIEAITEEETPVESALGVAVDLEIDELLRKLDEISGKEMLSSLSQYDKFHEQAITVAEHDEEVITPEDNSAEETQNVSDLIIEETGDVEPDIAVAVESLENDDIDTEATKPIELPSIDTYLAEVEAALNQDIETNHFVPETPEFVADFEEKLADFTEESTATDIEMATDTNEATFEEIQETPELVEEVVYETLEPTITEEQLVEAYEVVEPAAEVSQDEQSQFEFVVPEIATIMTDVADEQAEENEAIVETPELTEDVTYEPFEAVAEESTTTDIEVVTATDETTFEEIQENPELVEEVVYETFEPTITEEPLVEDYEVVEPAVEENQFEFEVPELAEASQDEENQFEFEVPELVEASQEEESQFEFETSETDEETILMADFIEEMKDLDEAILEEPTSIDITDTYLGTDVTLEPEFTEVETVDLDIPEFTEIEPTSLGFVETSEATEEIALQLDLDADVESTSLEVVPEVAPLQDIIGKIVIPGHEPKTLIPEVPVLTAAQLLEQTDEFEAFDMFPELRFFEPELEVEPEPIQEMMTADEIDIPDFDVASILDALSEATAEISFVDLGLAHKNVELTASLEELVKEIEQNASAPSIEIENVDSIADVHVAFTAENDVVSIVDTPAQIVTEINLSQIETMPKEEVVSSVDTLQIVEEIPTKSTAEAPNESVSVEETFEVNNRKDKTNIILMSLIIVLTLVVCGLLYLLLFN